MAEVGSARSEESVFKGEADWAGALMIVSTWCGAEMGVLKSVAVVGEGLDTSECTFTRECTILDMDRGRVDT
jgi:hypothetical protein